VRLDQNLTTGRFPVVSCALWKTKSPFCRPLRGGASRTRTGDLLGAISWKLLAVGRHKTDAAKFAKDTHDQDIRTTVEENVKQLQAGGFVAAIANSLGGVDREADAFSAAVEMGSPEGATDLLDARYEDYFSRAPMSARST
jgi:hypothetical protein